MAETANTLGVPATFTYEGRDYKVGPITLRVEAHMERHLQGLGLGAVQQMRGQLRLDEYRMVLDGHRRDCATGVYTWGGEACMQYLSTVEGVKYLAMLRLADSNQEDDSIDMDLVTRIWDDKAAWETLGVVCDTVDADPNQKRTASAT